MKYWAYLSYAHADERQALTVHRRIESFRVPKALRGREVGGQVVGARLRPLFRDRDELASSGNLKDSLETALRESGALIVLCTPAAARSKWVDQEITTFVARHGSARVFPLIVDGEPNSGDDRECFPPALRGEGEGEGGLEPVAGDLRPHADGRRDGVLKVIAGLLDVGFDVVKRRDAQRRHRVALAFATAASLVAIVTSLTALYAVHQRDIAEVRRAQAEDLITFMLGDLRNRLREVGRLDVLDAVGDKAESYFATLPASEINDHALEKQALALRQIGEVHLQQGEHASAQRAFGTSLSQFEALTERNPGDTEMLFERSQAEFWLGNSYYKALALDQARPLWERYARTATELVSLAPDNPDYRLEQAYARSNLGTLAVDQGDLDDAERAFNEAGMIFASLAGEKPDDPNLRFEVAANDSWLAAVHEARFDWPRAADYRRSAAAAHEAVTTATDHPFHKHIDANARVKQARAELALGRPDAALEAQRRATALYAALAEQDPSNLEWQLSWQSSQARLALIEQLASDEPETIQTGADAFDAALAIARTDPENALWAGLAVAAGLDLSTQLILRGGSEAAKQSLGVIEPLVRSNLAAAPDDAISARHFYELSILQRLVGEGRIEPALDHLESHPRQRRANLQLAALTARLAGDLTAAAALEARVAEAGYASPEFQSLRALARR